jgi:hypothetical protein
VADQPTGQQLDEWVTVLLGQLTGRVALGEFRTGNDVDLRSYRPSGPLQARLAKRLRVEGWTLQTCHVSQLNDGTGHLVMVAAVKDGE